MTRFEPETPAPRPAAEEGDMDHIPQPPEGRPEDSRDSLFERWLAHSTASQPRLRRSGVPAPAPSAGEAALGDDLADAWFR